MVSRITIIEKDSGCPLFDKVWSWKEGQKAASDMTALIQAFYQFATNVDEGRVTRVCFDTPPPEDRKKRPTMGPSFKASRSSGRRRSYFGSASLKTIEMFCSDDSHIRVSVFADMTHFDGNGVEVANAVLESFAREFKEKLAELKPSFVEAARNPEMALINTSFLPHFESFNESVDKLGLSPKPKAMPLSIAEHKLDEASEDDISLSLY